MSLWSLPKLLLIYLKRILKYAVILYFKVSIIQSNYLVKYFVVAMYLHEQNVLTMYLRYGTAYTYSL